jgi:histidyl-tRNA synthetase
MDTIRSGFERFGFVPVETPAFELVDVLLTKTGGETEKQVYFVQSTGAREQNKPPELALRFDLTVPLARYVAEHEHELSFPFRRYQMQRVYRGERNQKGRFREFYQCDIDVIGKDTLPLAYDAEMPAVIFHVFESLKVGPFTIRLNNRRLLRGLMEHFGVTGAEAQGAALREIDKVDKIGREKVQASLAEQQVARASEILDVMLAGGSSAESLARLEALGATNADFTQGFSELRRVHEALQAQGVPDKAARIVLSITRGLDYYTGTIYETFLDDHPGIGSVCSGGRYDDLAGLYTKSKLPGVGISIGATRLFFQLKEVGLLPAAPGLVQAYVTQMDPAFAPDCLALAADLRRAGVNTELAPEAGKMKRQMQYADRAKIAFVLILAGDEKDKGVVSVKDMRSGQQSAIARADVVEHIRKALTP